MAIQQADKLLKKHKDLHCAKVSVIVVQTSFGECSSEAWWCPGSSRDQGVS